MNKVLLLLSIHSLVWCAQTPKFEPTAPLHVKVYCTANPPFRIDEKEKPVNFQPYGDPYAKYSWIYDSERRPAHEQCFVLVGYASQDKDDILKKGVNKILSNPLFACLASPTAASANAATPPAPNVPAPATAPTAPATPPTVAQAPTTPAQPVQPPAATPVAQNPTPQPGQPTQGTPAQPATIVLETQTLNAPVSPTVPEATVYMCEGPQGQPPPVPAQQPTPKTSQSRSTNLAQSRPLIFEMKIICSNNPLRQVTQEQVEKVLPGAKVYGNSFDLPHHKKCNFIATILPETTPQPEVQEIMRQIYFGIKGPDNLFN